jgi:hypothetical protein
MPRGDPAGATVGFVMQGIVSPIGGSSDRSADSCFIFLLRADPCSSVDKT